MTKKDNSKGNILELGLPKIQTYEQLCSEKIAELVLETEPDKIWLMFEKDGELSFLHSHPTDIVHTAGSMLVQCILGIMEHKLEESSEEQE